MIFTTGTLYHYLQISGVLLLTCSSANIWWVICFPTRARYFFEKTARIHALQFSFCWILPVILIAITYAAGGTYIPSPSSRFCLPMPQPVMLGTFVLPLSLSSITIVIMLVHVINTLYNVSIMNVSNELTYLPFPFYSTVNFKRSVLHRR